jgi:hypothetical protein
MKDFLASLAPQVLDILGPMLIAALTYASVRLAAYIKAHTENVRAQGILLRLNDAVATGVDSVEQTVVSTLQASTVDGRLSPQAAGKAKDAAIALIKAQLGDKGLAELIAILGVAPAAVDGVISSKVEASVGKLPDSPPRPSNSGVVVPTGQMRGQPNDTTAVFPVDATEAKTPTLKPRDTTKGSASAIVLFALACAFFFGYAALFVSHKAHADALVLNLSDTWTCSPVAALTGEQLNLKTQTFQQGVSLGAGYGCRFTGWKLPLSIEAVGGFAANSNAPNAVQGNLIFVVADNYGIGPGAQVFKDPVSGDYVGQALVSFFLTASWAATTEQLQRAKATAAQAAKGAGQ